MAADDDLVQAARGALARAYPPYSGLQVGAALLGDDGRVFTGCNVENASYGLTICAERTAVVKAVSEGTRSFTAVAIVTSDPNPIMPCGACRQVLAEFAPDLRVIVEGTNGERLVRDLSALLPDAFRGRSEAGEDPS